MTPIDIDEVWPRIEPVVREIMAGDDATVDHILRDCREDKALCMSCGKDGEDGVVIVALKPNPYRGDLELLVMVAVGWGEHGAYERQAPHMDKLAHDLGAARIVFYTRRKGWEKKLGPGWKLREITFVREL